MQHSKKYSIIHISSHAAADNTDGNNSYILFTNPKDVATSEKLFASQLYNTTMPTDMVVLSACETGAGELRLGEGLISLARGFSYAGAKSIIASRWIVAEKSTRILLAKFYKHLKTGKTKSAAIRQARIEFIKEEPDFHPYFWAAFIPIGNMTPIQ